MSISNLIEKINSQAREGCELPIRPKMLQLYIYLLICAVIFNIGGFGGIMYLIYTYEKPQPVQVLCSDEVQKALEATSTPIKLLKQKVEKPIKKAKVKKLKTAKR